MEFIYKIYNLLHLVNILYLNTLITSTTFIKRLSLIDFNVKCLNLLAMLLNYFHFTVQRNIFQIQIAFIIRLFDYLKNSMKEQIEEYSFLMKKRAFCTWRVPKVYNVLRAAPLRPK